MLDRATWHHHNPVRIVQAPLEVLKRNIAGRNILLVTTPGFVRRGVADRIRQILAPSQVTIWDGVKPNPDLHDLDAARAQLSQQVIDAVIGLGGGSALDAAKVLAVTLSHREHPTLEQVFRYKEEGQWNSRLQLVAIPTTSGTGAEVTPFSTIWDHVEHRKYSLAGDFVYPDVALLDVSLTLTLGEEDTLYPALDTFSHALESLWNKNSTPVSQIFAIKALSIAIEALPTVLQDPSSYASRQEMQLSSSLAGIAISQTRTALAHSISYPLTAHFDVPHGLACGFTLPRLITHFLKCQPTSSFAPVMQRAQILIERFELDKILRNYVNEDNIHKIEEEMYTPERAGNFSVAMPELQSIWREPPSE